MMIWEQCHFFQVSFLTRVDICTWNMQHTTQRDVKVVMNLLEFNAFMSPGAFTESVDLFLENLLNYNQATVCFTTANQGGFFKSENGSWSAP